MGETISLDYWDVIKQIDAELERINWTVETAKNHIRFHYGVKSRMLLKDNELLDFLDYLKSLPTYRSRFVIKPIGIKKYSL